MPPETKKVEKIIDGYKGYLKSISDGISEGISEGVKEGVEEGLTQLVKDGLKECLLKGFISTGQEDIKDILEDIPEELIKNSVKEASRQVFKISTEDYVQQVCQKLADRIKKGDIKLSKAQTGLVLGLVKRSEQETVKKMVGKLPNNPLLKAVVAGIQKALEESLEKNFKTCAERTWKEKEIEGKSLEKRRKKWQKKKELKKSVKESVKNVVKETVSGVVRRLVKASTKRLIRELKKKLKEKAIQRLEERLKDITEKKLEKQLNKSIKQVTKEIVKDNVERVDFVKGIERGFGKGFGKYLLSLTKGLLTPIVITCVCVLAVGGGVLVTYNVVTSPLPSPPPPSAPPPTQYVLQMGVYPPGGGSVNTSGGTYDLGTEITLTATPSPCYQFASWTGDFHGTSPTITITMDHDWSLVANFELMLTPPLGSPVLQSPTPGSQDVDPACSFSWAPVPGATKYELIIATDAALTHPIAGTPVIVPSPLYGPVPGEWGYGPVTLEYDTTYWYAVKEVEPSESPQNIGCFHTIAP
jgi:hypothetical protein